MNPHSIIKFGIGGGMGVISGYIIGVFLNHFGAPYYIASGIGYMIGFIVNYSTQVKLGNINVQK